MGQGAAAGGVKKAAIVQSVCNAVMNFPISPRRPFKGVSAKVKWVGYTPFYGLFATCYMRNDISLKRSNNIIKVRYVS